MKRSKLVKSFESDSVQVVVVINKNKNCFSTCKFKNYWVILSQEGKPRHVSGKKISRSSSRWENLMGIWGKGGEKGVRAVAGGGAERKELSETPEIYLNRAISRRDITFLRHFLSSLWKQVIFTEDLEFVSHNGERRVRYSWSEYEAI